MHIGTPRAIGGRLRQDLPAYLLLARQLPIRQQVPNCLRTPSEAIQQTAKIEMRIGELRVKCQGAAVVRDSGIDPLLIFKRERQVVMRDRIVGVAFEGAMIEPTGLQRIASFVDQASKVDVRVGQFRVEFQGATIGIACTLGVVLALELQGALEQGQWALRAAALPAPPFTGLADRCGAARRTRQLINGEFKDALSAFGVPGTAAVTYHDMLSIGKNAHP